MSNPPIFSSDYKFWESLEYLIRGLTPLYEFKITTAAVPYYANCKLRYRLIANISYPDSSKPAEAAVFVRFLIFLNESPNYFVPIGRNLYCLVPGVPSYGALCNKKGIFEFFLLYCESYPDIYSYMKNAKGQILKALDDETFEAHYEQNSQSSELYCPFGPKLTVQGIKNLVDDFYSNFYKYIKRHYNRNLWGMDLPSKLNMSAAILQALVLYKQPRFPYQTPINFSIFGLKDDTLFIRRGDKNEVINSNTLFQLFGPCEWNLPRSLHSAGKELLQKYQKLLCQGERLHKISPDNHVITYQFLTAGLKISYNKTKKVFKSTIQNSQGTDSKVKEQWDFRAVVLFLFEITGGDISVLQDFSRFIMYCSCCHTKEPKVVYFPKELYKSVTFMIQSIENQYLPSSGKVNIGPIPLSSIKNKKSIDTLISHKLNNERVICCNDDLGQLSETQQKWLSKVLRGKTVSKKDPILGRKKHKSTAQFIIFGDDSTLAKLKKMGVPVLSPRINSFSEVVRSITSPWFSTMLSLWAIIHMGDRSAAQAPIAAQTVDLFMRQHCELCKEDRTKFIEAHTLYEKYTAFCDLIGRNDKLKFKDFNDSLENIYGLERKQRHMQKGKSPTVFYGIQLLTNQPALEPEAEKESQKITDFYSSCVQISKEILEKFPDLPGEWKDILRNKS